MTTTAHQQPQIDPSDALLCASYLHKGLSLDIYGQHDEDGYHVFDVTLAGSTVSLYELVAPAVLCDMEARLTKILPTGEHLRQESRDENRISTAMYEDGGGI